jgi:hypothetical protein
MHNNSGIGWSRRHWLALAGSGVLGIRLYGAETDFWNQKDPSEWTSVEIATLLAKSPWAKEATPQSESTAQSVASGLARGGRRHSVGSSQPAAKGVIVWESSQAVLDARKKALPDQFANHYTLSVSGIPLPDEAETDLYDQLRQFTSLHPDDQPPAQPGLIQKIEGSANGLLLGFSKDVLQLSTVDKTIEFSTTVGKMAVSAKFETKYMLYKGQLAV